MKKTTAKIMAMLIAATTMVSCLGSNDEELTYYDDTAIASFTLGTLNRYLHSTTSSGADTIIKSNVTGANYKFTIDQLQHTIYNVDSLPYGTDITKVLCTITAKNGGSIVIQSPTSDSVKYHSSTDSVDFTTPRKFHVYSNSGRYHQDYTVTVNAHKQQSDQFVWERMAVGGAFEGMTNMRAFEVGNRMFVAGSDGTITMFAYTSTDDGLSWHRTSPNINTLIPANAYQNIVVKDETVYMLMNNTIMTSADCETWQQQANTDLAQLIGTDGQLLFALSNENNLMSSADNGLTWNIEKLDDNNNLLPSQDISMITLPLQTNNDAHRVVLVGNRNATNYPQDKHAMVWSKIIENDEQAQDKAWMRYTQDENAPYQAPRQRNLTVIPYANGMIAVGGYPIGASTTAAFEAMFFSADNGLTWKSDSRFSLPSAFKNVAINFAMTVDKNHFIWLFSNETGEIWRARLSQLGWEDPQTIFRTKKK